jgi:sulfite oxidase
VEVTATLQCSGNRRAGFNDLKLNIGDSVGSRCRIHRQWGGVKLADLLEFAGLEDAFEAEERWVWNTFDFKLWTV